MVMLRASFKLVAPTGGTHPYGVFFQLGGSNIVLVFQKDANVMYTAENIVVPHQIFGNPRPM